LKFECGQVDTVNASDDAPARQAIVLTFMPLLFSRGYQRLAVSRRDKGNAVVVQELLLKVAECIETQIDLPSVPAPRITLLSQYFSRINKVRAHIVFRVTLV
jgi:hypothetical protein